MEIWHFSHRTTPNVSVLKSLTQAGLSSHHAKSHNGGPGIVFFDEFSNELAELLRETSRRGLERVLAISLSRRAIDRAAPNVRYSCDGICVSGSYQQVAKSQAAADRAQTVVQLERS